MEDKILKALSTMKKGDSFWVLFDKLGIEANAELVESACKGLVSQNKIEIKDNPNGGFHLIHLIKPFKAK